MKFRRFCCILLVLLAAFFFTAGCIQAAGNPPGLEYTLSDGQITITGYTGTAASLIIPATIDGFPVTKIGSYTFDSCTQLVSVTLPASLKALDAGAFRNCTGLTGLVLPEELETIGSNAFFNCTSLASIVIRSKNLTEISGSTNTFGNAGVDVPQGTAVTFCDSAASVPGYLFCCTAGNSANIKTVSICSSVTTIGDRAFEGCGNLTTVSIPADSELTAIGRYAFRNCSSLTQILLPKKLESIGTGAFSGCYGLSSITVGAVKLSSLPTNTFSGIGRDSGGTDVVFTSSVTAIPDGMFSCSQETYAHVRTVSIGKAVTTIGSYAFSCCADLTSVAFAPGAALESIGQYAFKACSALSAIAFPATTNTLQAYAFLDCSGLNTIAFSGNAPTIQSSAFTRVTADAYIPQGNATWTASLQGSYGGSLSWNRYSPVSIITQPKTAYACSGDTVKTTVTARGEGLTYQWYFKNYGSDSYELSAVTSASYSCTMRDSSKNRNVYCVITDKYGNCVQTSTARLRMAATITEQPVSVSTAAGQQAAVTVGAAGEGLTYRWYYKDAGSTKFLLTTTFTGNRYYVTMNAARDGRQVYCVVTDQYGKTAVSDVATLHMVSGIRITAQPVTAYAQSGSTVRVSVTASGEDLHYQWYIKSATGVRYSKSSVTGPTYSCTMSATSKDRYVYCVIIDRYGSSLQTDTVQLRMAATITVQPVSVRAAAGQQAAVTVGAVGDELTYQWYYKNPGSSKFLLTTAFTGNRYCVAMTAARDGRQVYCIVSDKYGNCAISDTVTLSMN